jgi:general secretion pathway protein I
VKRRRAGLRVYQAGLGMTLVECLVASVILGVGVAGLISAASLALRNQQATELRATAVWLAQEKLAEVELKGPYASQSLPTQGTQEQQGVRFAWTLTIEPESVGELYRVRAKVEWTGQTSSGQVELETLLNDYEPDVTAEQGSQSGAAQQSGQQGQQKQRKP